MTDENTHQENDDTEVITEITEDEETVSLKKAELAEIEKDEKRLAKLIANIEETRETLWLVLISKVEKFVAYFEAKRTLDKSLKEELELSVDVEDITATLKNKKKNLKEAQSNRMYAYQKMEEARQFIEAHLSKKIISQQMTLF